jgi:hypothetical protein
MADMLPGKQCLQCDYCAEFVAEKLADLLHHEASVHRAPHFKCVPCKSVFPNRQALSDHRKTQKHKAKVPQPVIPDSFSGDSTDSENSGVPPCPSPSPT